MAFKLEWSEEALKDFTELGRVVPETNNINIREIFIYSYRLIYKINENTILFVAIVHGKRLLENHQQSITKHLVLWKVKSEKGGRQFVKSVEG